MTDEPTIVERVRHRITEPCRVYGCSGYATQTIGTEALVAAPVRAPVRVPVCQACYERVTALRSRIGLAGVDSAAR